MGSPFQLLKDCAPPVPLSGGDELKLCSDGYVLNFQHAEAQSLETAANAEMTEAPDDASRKERFERLKEVVLQRHDVMREMFSHVSDCYICSIAFGLTPAPKPKPDRKLLTQFLARLTRAAWLSKMKTSAERI